MGLASKLAASQGTGGPAGYPQSYPPPQAQTGSAGYPGQQQYQTYHPQQPAQQQNYQQPQLPQQQYGANPPYPSRPQAQVPSPGGPVKVAAFKQALQQAIHQKGLHNFPINNAARLDAIAARAPQQIDEVCNRWRVNREIANDIVRLALYDIVIFVDDSGSMSFEEGGERIKDLELILTRVAFAATLFDDDGISIRFMNDTSTPGPQLDHITSEKQVMGLLNGRRYKGLTPLGTQLRKQVVDGMVLPALSSGRAEKPYLVIVITDGQPAGESPNTVQEIIQHAVNSAKASHGTGAIAFEFAQVGNDQKATEFLSNLDNHQIVGSMVDCTSNFENESAECARAQPPVDLTPDLWVIKLLLGAIDPSYDDKDEKSAPTGYTQAPPSQYIQPPPGQPYSAPASQSYYGGPQQQAPYGQQPPYGQQAQQQGAYGGPPPGQYGQQPPSQYGQPPSGPPPGQYGGQPPQQYGARPPGGQAPPYPPRY